MECAKEKWYEVKYNTKLDRLLIKKESFLNKVKRFIKIHNFITITGITFVIFSSINVILIYNFFTVLEKIMM